MRGAPGEAVRLLVVAALMFVSGYLLGRVWPAPAHRWPVAVQTARERVQPTPGEDRERFRPERLRRRREVAGTPRRPRASPRSRPAREPLPAAQTPPDRQPTLAAPEPPAPEAAASPAPQASPGERPGTVVEMGAEKAVLRLDDGTLLELGIQEFFSHFPEEDYVPYDARVMVRLDPQGRVEGIRLLGEP